jgi:hypothetical protein
MAVFENEFGTVYPDRLRFPAVPGDAGALNGDRRLSNALAMPVTRFLDNIPKLQVQLASDLWCSRCTPPAAAPQRAPSPTTTNGALTAG